MRKFSLIIFLLSLLGILSSFSSCVKPFEESEFDFQKLSFRNIPGITEDEIKAIETLQKKYDFFIYGMPHGIEAFNNIFADNEVRGYSALLCEWLTSVFGIKFEPKLFEWLELLALLETGEVSFTGELTASPERRQIYHMTNSIASRPLKMFRLAGSRLPAEITAERPLRCGFIEGTTTIYTVTSELDAGAFDVVLLQDVSFVYDALKSGVIDAFFYTITADANFIEHSDIIIHNFFPLTYRPVSLSTRNDELIPIISAVEKILEAGGIRYLISLYNQAEQEYQIFKMQMRLTDEEREYIKNNPVVRTGIDPGNYPSSFFDRREKEWRGVSIDILKEVSDLTGLTFKRVNDQYAGWSEILEMLRIGKVTLVPELAYSPERSGQFLWSGTVQMVDYYALISEYNFPDIKENEILYVKVGLAKNTVFKTIFNKWFPNHMNTVEYENMDDAFDALHRGEIDMVMANQKRLLYLTHYLELPNYKVNIVFDYANYIQFGLARDEVILRSIIDKALNMINVKGISEQWMRRTYDYRSKVAEAQFPWLVGSSILIFGVLALVAVLLIISYQTSRKLEELVKKRTHELELKTVTLTTLFDSIPDLIFTKDLKLRYTQCNKSMAEHFNFRREDAIGKTDLMPYGLAPDLSSKYNDMLKDTIRDRKIHMIEGVMPRHDGTTPVFESMYAPLLLGGTVIGVLGISRDVTKRKEMEEAALAASHSKSLFLANMSHEIRTPMNSIIGFAELSLDEHLPIRTKDYIGKIIENAEGLLQIINDILDISKVESGKMELENIPFDLHEIFTSCRTLISPKAMEKGLQVHYYAEPTLGIKPLGDPTRLRQVLLNLLTNAVKFTESGIIKVSAIINEKTDKTAKIHFMVKDSGIGMTQDQLQKIFDPFVQAETGTTRKYGGTGLGLTITKNIIEMMGGKLFVESVPGMGSKFTFDIVFKTIDVFEDHPVQKYMLNESEKPTFKGEILICEDNAMNQQVISEHLSRVGLKAIIAENGKVGVEMVKNRIRSGKKLFDLIFMDIYMPVMDGLEASAKIIELNTGIPIVTMTANIMSNDRAIYSGSGMKDCLGKPFTSQELWRCLLRYLKPLKMEKNQDKEQIEKAMQNTQAAGNANEAEKNFLISLQLMFYKQNQNKYEEIVQALGANDIALAHRLVHTLKSNAGQLRKVTLQSAAADVEYQLRDGKNQPTEESLKILRAELDIVFSQLAEEIAPLLKEAPSANTDPDQKKLNAEETRELFKKLEPLLASGNPECISFVQELKAAAGDEILVKQLMEQMEDFNFDEAYSTLVKLKEMNI